MRAARAVALFAADIPFSHCFDRNIIVDGMAAIAERPGSPLEIIRRIERSPPVGGIGHKIPPPHFVRDVPLGWLWKIVVADFGEIALLPAAAVNECDIVF